jgi:murein DD-endopeptidase MepM/ murein hydrolase activator NlpD
LNNVQFVNPLSNPGCAGYIQSRGFWGIYAHNGVDLAKNGGCPVRAAAEGDVIFAGWSDYGEGYNVRIYHGNGVQTSYYHGETIWVSVGDHVTAGQEIMYMGCTGNCSGTHVHLGLRLDGTFIDPSPYIPY